MNFKILEPPKVTSVNIWIDLPDQHHELVHPPAVNAYPFPSHGAHETRNEEKSWRTVHSKTHGHGSNGLCKLFLDKRFIGHPEAVVKALPQPHHFNLLKKKFVSMLNFLNTIQQNESRHYVQFNVYFRRWKIILPQQVMIDSFNRILLWKNMIRTSRKK